MPELRTAWPSETHRAARRTSSYLSAAALWLGRPSSTQHHHRHRYLHRHHLLPPRHLLVAAVSSPSVAIRLVLFAPPGPSLPQQSLSETLAVNAAAWWVAEEPSAATASLPMTSPLQWTGCLRCLRLHLHRTGTLYASAVAVFPKCLGEAGTSRGFRPVDGPGREPSNLG